MSPNAPTHDARAWTGPLPDDWPRRSDWLAPPRRVEIWRSPSKLARAVLLDLVLIGCVALAWTQIAEPTVVTIFSSIGLSVVALALAFNHWRLRQRAVASRTPLLVLDATGLSWPEVLDGVVPWRDIVQVVNVEAVVGARHLPPPLSGLFLELRDPTRIVVAAGASSILWNDASSVRLRLPSSLDRRRRELHDLIQAFRAHHGS